MVIQSRWQTNLTVFCLFTVALSGALRAGDAEQHPWRARAGALAHSAWANKYVRYGVAGVSTVGCGGGALAAYKYLRAGSQVVSTVATKVASVQKAINPTQTMPVIAALTSPVPVGTGLSNVPVVGTPADAQTIKAMEAMADYQAKMLESMNKTLDATSDVLKKFSEVAQQNQHPVIRMIGFGAHVLSNKYVLGTVGTFAVGSAVDMCVFGPRAWWGHVTWLPRTAWGSLKWWLDLKRRIEFVGERVNAVDGRVQTLTAAVTTNHEQAQATMAAHQQQTQQAFADVQQKLVGVEGKLGTLERLVGANHAEAKTQFEQVRQQQAASERKLVEQIRDGNMLLTTITAAQLLQNQESNTREHETTRQQVAGVQSGVSALQRDFNEVRANASRVAGTLSAIGTSVQELTAGQTELSDKLDGLGCGQEGLARLMCYSASMQEQVLHNQKQQRLSFTDPRFGSSFGAAVILGQKAAMYRVPTGGYVVSNTMLLTDGRGDDTRDDHK